VTDFRDESGFSLIELLVSILIGMIVVMALLQFFDVGWSTATTVDDRQESTIHARSDVTRVANLLQAQVCNGTIGTGATAADVAPIHEATRDGVVFAAATGAIGGAVDGYKAVHDPVTNQLSIEKITLGAPAAGTGYSAWPSGQTLPTPTTYAAPAPAPVFTYWAWDKTTADWAPLNPEADGFVSAANRQRVVRVNIEFNAYPTRTKNSADKSRTIMEASAMVSSNVKSEQLELGPQC